MTETVGANANDNSTARRRGGDECITDDWRLNRRWAALIVLALSLGLWAAIWAVLAYLVSWAMG